MKLSTGFFVVEAEAGAVDVKLRVLLDNVSYHPAEVVVTVAKLRGREVTSLVSEELRIPGGERSSVEVGDILGESVQVTLDLPDPTLLSDGRILPSVAVVNFFSENLQRTTVMH